MDSRSGSLPDQLSNYLTTVFRRFFQLHLQICIISVQNLENYISLGINDSNPCNEVSLITSDPLCFESGAGNQIWEPENFVQQNQLGVTKISSAPADSNNGASSFYRITLIF